MAWRLGGELTYCLDGQVYTAGSAVRWLADIGVLAEPASLDAVGQTVPALTRLGAGQARSVAEAVGPAEAEAIVEPAITADEAAERIVAFRSALPLALAGR